MQHFVSLHFQRVSIVLADTEKFRISSLGTSFSLPSSLTEIVLYLHQRLSDVIIKKRFGLSDNLCDSRILHRIVSALANGRFLLLLFLGNSIVRCNRAITDKIEACNEIVGARNFVI